LLVRDKPVGYEKPHLQAARAVKGNWIVTYKARLKAGTFKYVCALAAQWYGSKDAGYGQYDVIDGIPVRYKQ
jgi:hypothetical protein